MIMSDQHTPSVIGCYGNTDVKTPNLDRLAENGVLFENAYCNNPVCVPSRMSMLTGLRSSKINVWANSDCLSPHFATWPLLLRLSGYETVICGRNHMLWGDRLNGFGKRLCGDTGVTIPYIRPGKTQQSEKSPQGIDTQLGPNNMSGLARHDIGVSEHAIKYLKNPPENPFALYIGFYQPHAPFVALEEYFDKYSGLSPSSRRDERIEPPYDKMLLNLNLDREIPDEKIKTAVRAYYAMVSHVDELVGKIVRQAEESGLLENTVIVYVSDHGEMLGRHRLWHKMCFYEDSVRVPMIFNCPSMIAGNRRVKQNVSLLDLFPTFLEIAGNSEKISLDGNSLLPFLENRKSCWNNSVISETIGIERGKPGRMLKKDNFKLICYHQEKPILFDLDADPEEQVNLSESPAHIEVIREMLAELTKAWDVDRINNTFDENMKHVYFHNRLSLRK